MGVSLRICVSSCEFQKLERPPYQALGKHVFGAFDNVIALGAEQPHSGEGGERVSKRVKNMALSQERESHDGETGRRQAIPASAGFARDV